MKAFLWTALGWLAVASLATFFLKLGLELGEQLELLVWLMMH